MIPPYLLALAHHLWQSTLFAAAAGLLTLCFRGNRAPVRYGLWLAASLKFLVPFSLLVAIGSQFEGHSAVTPKPMALAAVVQQISEPFAPALWDGIIWFAPPRPATRVPPILVGVWLCGFLASLLPWCNRWRRIRKAMRGAKPLRIDAPIPLLSSAARLEPGVFGIVRPVLLLPEGLTGHLTPAQFDAVLAHELCHVRRHDNLAAAVHMVVEALFWFHPLVWWIETRLVEERERACDEEVLRGQRDPEVYAEGILSICKLYLESPLACMSGVTGANLKSRIEAIMTQRALQNLTAGKKLLLAAAGAAALALPLMVGMADLPAVRAQSQNDKPIRAEVVSVKRNTTEEPRSFGSSRAEPGGKLTIRGTPLYAIIAKAYQVPLQSPRLSGGPEWVKAERYDIDAIAEPGAIPADLTATERSARFERMLQGILADRFKLKMVLNDKNIPVYILSIGKNGPKLKKSQYEETDCAGSGEAARNQMPNDRVTSCHSFNGGRGRGIHAKAVTIPETVAFAENWSDRPIVDKTGLAGLYDIDTEGWLPMNALPPRDPPPPGATPSAEMLALSDPATPTLFVIFERLGLHLEPQKAAVPTYVIDHVERPTEN